jgi:uncharacterized SAM-binding protein YcdF (DUF218 family)
MTTTAAATQTRRKSAWPMWLVGFLFFALVVYFAVTANAILYAASLQELHPSDAIVVFGAAEYSGRPSPVYRARLDHAYELFERKLAPVVITTGGAAHDPKYNEGQVGHDYLMERGVPDASLIAETQASDTAESAVRVATIMRENHMHTVLAVSDEYHVFRIRKMLEHEGVKVYLAPRSDSRPHSVWQKCEGVTREAASYLLWKLDITG